MKEEDSMKNVQTQTDIEKENYLNKQENYKHIARIVIILSMGIGAILGIIAYNYNWFF